MLFAQRQRKEIIDKLRNTFVEADRLGLIVDEKKALAEICVTYGSTLRKAKEYIQELLDLGFIERTELGLILSIKYKTKPEGPWS